MLHARIFDRLHLASGITVAITRSTSVGSQRAAIMETPQDFKFLQEGIQKSLVSTVKSVNRIAAEDLGFQRTVNPDVAEQLDDKSARVLELSTRLLQSAAKACGVKAPRLEDAEDIDMSWQSIVDVVDSVLEKADTALDEYTGLVKRKEPPSTDAVSHILSLSYRVPMPHTDMLPPGLQIKTSQVNRQGYPKCQCYEAPDQVRT